jgi:hypothetical protein
MREVLDQLEGLIQFQGLNFRSTSITCNHCGWRGTGGALEVPGLAASGEPVVYACPACMESVAVHNGLTDQEVMQEMEKIREILAAELMSAAEPTADESPSRDPRPDFAAIRAQLPTAAHIAAEKAAALADADSDKAATEDAFNQGAAERNPVPGPDFAAIRARLGVPA